MPVTVGISKGARNALGAGAERVRERLEKRFNEGLKRLKANGDQRAADLYDSDQKIKIVCFGEKEAKDAGITAPAFGGGPAVTVGDFDADGKPREGGTALVIIDCKLLANVGLFGPIAMLGERTCFLRILYHELLHATNKARTHPPDDISVYDDFVRAFLDETRELEQENIRKRQKELRERRLARNRERRRFRKLEREGKGDSDEAKELRRKVKEETAGLDKEQERLDGLEAELKRQAEEKEKREEARKKAEAEKKKAEAKNAAGKKKARARRGDSRRS